MDIMEMIKKYKLEQEGADVDGFNKEFRETFKHVEEVKGIRQKTETLEKQNKELVDKLKSFDGVDVEKYKKEIEDLKAQQAKELEKQKINNFALQELYKNNIKSVNVGMKLLNLDDVNSDNFEKEIPNRVKALMEDETTSFAFKVQKTETKEKNFEGLNPASEQGGKEGNPPEISIGKQMAEKYNAKYIKNKE